MSPTATPTVDPDQSQTTPSVTPKPPEPTSNDTPTPQPSVSVTPTSGASDSPTPSAPQVSVTESPNITQVVTPVLTDAVIPPDPLGLEVHPSYLRLDTYEATDQYVEVTGYSNREHIRIANASELGWVKVVRLSDAPGAVYAVDVSENEGTRVRSKTVIFEDTYTGERAYLYVSQPGRTFAVTFNYNTGENSYTITRTYSVGDTYGELPGEQLNEKERSFDGWYTDPKEGKKISPEDTVDPYNTVLYAHYDAAVVEVEFVFGDKHGEDVPDKSYKYVRYGEPFGAIFPRVEEPKNSQILAWVDAEGTFYEETSVVSALERIVLTPIWGDKDEYLVIFDGNGSLDGSMDILHCKRNQPTPWPEVGYDKGVGFIGWSKTPVLTLSNPPIMPNDMVDPILNLVDEDTGHIILYALWNESKCVTYYDPFREAEVFTEPIKHAFKPLGADALPQFAYEGLELIGWSRYVDWTEPVGCPILFDTSKEQVTNLLEDLRLYPVYKVKKDGDYAVFLYDSRNDTVDVQFTNNASPTIILPEPANQTSQYEFLFWTTQRGAGENAASDYRFYANSSFVTAPALDDPACIILETVYRFNPVFITFNYGYDNKIKVVEATEEVLTLPDPVRKGYVFCGWGEGTNQNNTSEDPARKYYRVHQGGAEYRVPRYDSELYAIWEPATFTIEWYDGITGDMIWAPETINACDTISDRHIPIAGLKFVGWSLTPFEPILGLHKSSRGLDFVLDATGYDTFYDALTYYAVGSSFADLPYENGVVKLYSCYEPIRKDGCVTVIFHPNKGAGTPMVLYLPNTKNFTIPDLDMHRDGCEFAGWKLLNYHLDERAVRYLAGDPFALLGAKVLCFVAQWDSKYEFGIDPKYADKPYIDLSDTYKPGDVIKIETLYDCIDRPGYYPRTWTNSDGEKYWIDDYYVIPEHDVTFYPNWEMKQFKIVYHNGFETDEFVVEPVDATARLSFNEENFPWLYVDGYKFIGWSTSNYEEVVMPLNIPQKYIVTRVNNELRYLDNDLHVFACYEENKVPDGKVRFLYNPMGGTGGPGEVLYDIGAQTEYYIEKEIPDRPGYIFDGWTTVHTDPGAEYIPGQLYTGEIYDNDVKLYAVWRSESTNPLKKQLQSYFGKNVMPDYYFECEYESSEWEQIKPYCYFVIKTENGARPGEPTSMTSQIMLMEFRGGTWYLTGDPISAKALDVWEYEIQTTHKDVEARLLLAGKDLALTIVDQIPIAKRMLQAEELQGEIINLIYELGERGSMHEAALRRITSTIYKMIYQNYKNEYGDIMYLSDVINKSSATIESIVKNALFCSADNMIDAIEQFGLYIKWVTMDYDVDKMLAIFTDTETVINDNIAEQFKLRDSDMFDNLSLDGLKDFVTGDLLECAWSIVWDNIRYVKDFEDLDPYGTFDGGFKAFREELNAKHFCSHIYASFPDVIKKVYKIYYDLD